MLPYPSIFGSLATLDLTYMIILMSRLPYPSIFGSLATCGSSRKTINVRLPYPSIFGSLAT